MTDQQTRLVEKARRALSTARLVLDDGDVEGALNRAYYACFYVAQALLLTYGEEPRTHRGVHHRFRERAVLPGLVPAELGRTLPYAASLRERADYEAVTVTDTAGAADLLADAHTFVDAVLRVLEKAE
ncbi:HEPN domain-containing protein [Rubrivirga sp.]|uniref:HEPN domain-containing protein n=1 Tax=Rubrivirga sp. TaxID=1885344 RepID=UPI003B51B511